MKKILVLFLFLAGCQYRGTGTGNPMEQANNSAPTAASGLVGDICRKLTSCHSGLTPKACNDSVWMLSGLAASFGAQAPIDTMAQADSAEINSTLAPVSSFKSQCTTSISSLDCLSQLVQDAYQSSSATPFALLPAMIPPVCGQVYPP
ncbi:MAG: hypothetical protein ABL958_05455 [Bdellovibrionia bacterium]